MNYEQKLLALNALSECSILMRKPGDWYVAQKVEVKDDSILIGKYGNGAYPETAINDHWEQLTNLKDNQYLVFRERDKRKAVKWNGFMWSEVNEQTN